MKANKKRIQQQLVELVFQQVDNSLEHQYEVGVPNIMRDNIKQFAGLLVKSKALQEVFADFNDRVARILDYEMAQSQTLISDYLNHPMTFNKKPPSLYPAGVAYGKKAMNVFHQARTHIKEVEKDYKVQVIKKKKAAKIELTQAEKLKDKLRQQVQNMGQVFLQSDSNEPKKILLTPMQQDMVDRVEVIIAQMNELENNNAELHEDVVATEKDLTDTRAAKMGKMPGHAIQGMLTKWQDDKSWFNQTDLKLYVDELWLTKEQFEQKLTEQQTAMKIELTMRKAAFVTRVDAVRSHASFRIQALESALIETKIRYKREAERAEMRLAEMESTLLNTQQDEKQVDNALDQAAQMMQEDDPTKPPPDPEKQVKLLKANMAALVRSIESFKAEKKIQVSKINELESVIEQNKGFNAKMQDEFKKAKEMTIFYQILAHDILKTTKAFESSSTTHEEKILFQEIFELNEERLRRDKEEEEKAIRIDHKKKLQRLSKYVDDVHAIFLSLDFKTIFDNMQKVNDIHSKLQKALALELSDAGLIQFQHVNQHAIAKSLSLIIRDQELTITDRSKVEPSFTRFVPKRDQPLEYLQGMKALQPLGIIKPERRFAIHTILEQLMIPNQDYLQMVIKEEREKAEEIARLDEEERILQQTESDLMREYKAKKEGLLESQHPEINKQFLGDSQKGMNKQELKNNAAVVQKTQEHRKQELDKKEKAQKAKEAAEQRAKEASEFRKNQAAKKGGAKGKQKQAPKLQEPVQDHSQDRAKSRQKNKTPQRKDSQESAVNSLPLIEVNVRGKSKHGDDPDFLRNGTNSTLRGKASKASLDEIRTQAIGDQLVDALHEVESKVISKYKAKLEEASELEKKELSLTNRQFENLYEIFGQSLGTTLNSKDYMQLFSSTQIEAFLNTANELQAKYLRPDQNKGNILSETDSANKDTSNEIPYADLIQTDIDANGDFKGFKIRTEVAKVLFVDTMGDISKIGKVVKTVNYLNRLLNQQDMDFSLGLKKSAAKNDKSDQCDLIKEIIKYVEVPVPTKPEDEKEEFVKEVVKEGELPEIVKDFFATIRNHCIGVLMRMTPEKQSYYKMVWANQTPEALLHYKLPQVHEEVPPEGIDEADREYLDTMNVSQYMKYLFKMLDEKLLMNIPDSDKVDLDVKKLIWQGDSVPDEALAPVFNQKDTRDSAVQTPIEMIESPPQSKHSRSNFGKQKLSVSISAKKNERSASREAPKKPTVNKYMQTDEKQFRLWLDVMENKDSASMRLKEQIDSLMGEEIGKTIESLHQYIGRVKATQQGDHPAFDRNRMSDATIASSAQVGKSDRLKNQIRGLRNEVETESLAVMSDIEQLQHKRQKNELRNNLKDAMKEGPISKPQEKFPSIQSQEAPKTTTNRSPIASKTSTQSIQPGLPGQQLSHAKRYTKAAGSQNPFKQNKQANTTQSQWSTYDDTRTVSGSMPHNYIQIKMDLNNPSIDSESREQMEFTTKLIDKRHSSRQNNFFTGEARKIVRGPMKAELIINQGEHQFLSPRMSRSKNTLKSPNQDLNQVSPFYYAQNLSIKQSNDPLSPREGHLNMSATDGFQRSIPAHKGSMQFQNHALPRVTPLAYTKHNQKTPTKTANEFTRQERGYATMVENKRLSDSDQASIFYGVSTDPRFAKKQNFGDIEINRVSTDEY